MSKIYISGPMSGRPYYNFPHFDLAAKLLREDGFEVVNPAEEDGEEVRAACLQCETGAGNIGQSWGDALARDVKLLGDSEEISTICLLPGWADSRGAQLEVMIGLQRGMNFLIFLHAADWMDENKRNLMDSKRKEYNSNFARVEQAKVADVLAGEIFHMYNKDIMQQMQAMFEEMSVPVEDVPEDDTPKVVH